MQSYVLAWRRQSYFWAALVLVAATDQEGLPSQPNATHDRVQPTAELGSC